MAVSFGALILIKAFNYWKIFNAVLLVGHVVPSDLAWSKSSDDCLKDLRWPSLKSCHDYFSVSLLYDIIHKKIAIKFNDFCSVVSSASYYSTFADNH